MSIASTAAWKALERHAREVERLSLRDLLADPRRCRRMTAEHDGVLLDYSRQLATAETVRLLLALGREAGLKRKLGAMRRGARVNRTEDRAVMHVALRAARGTEYRVDGEDVVPEVHRVIRKVRRFAEEVRSGKRRGATGKKLTQVLSIGIGGSYLGPEFAAEAFRTEPACAKAARGRELRFLANVDPIDAHLALDGLDPERTLVVIVSKTFTTAETMLNARTVRRWLVKGGGERAVERQMVAVSTNRAKVKEFGIDPRNMFGFWDWVGGRYSVCSAVGLLPLSLQYGFEPVDAFLAGARSMDDHLFSAPPSRNLPILLGLFGVWNSSFLGHPARALLPYCQALAKLPPHIQQVDMESNGKRVDLEGKALPFEAGEIDFGEPGTNGQHSFYQLLHQGRVVPADFVGFVRSQRPIRVPGEPVANHDELMSNFFAQPDALAVGKTAAECRAEGVPEALVP
ncbi:MAG: glucose-6-phosphate isomerase, partial [Planctomycetota bacterium JB042]